MGRQEGAIATDLELHYFLEGNSHAMDAYVRNRCEAELLEMAKAVADVLNIGLEIETQAFAEGGLKELWNFVGKSHNQLTLIVCILTLIYSRFPASDPDMTDLQKKKMRLEILALEKELGIPEEEKIKDVEKTVNRMVNDPRVVKRKSNYYSKLLRYSKVDSLSWSQLDDAGEPVECPVYIYRREFHKFILTTDELEPVVDDEATIEIIAPVLKNGRYKWKGIYQGEVISFRMKDDEFRTQVVSGEVPFVNGTCIDCVLHMSRELTEIGEIKVSAYNVIIVNKVHDEAATVETPQGKRYKQHQKDLEGQIHMDLESGSTEEDGR